MTAQLSREWLQKTISDIETMRDEMPFGLDEDGNNTLAALKLALAGMSSEPYWWAIENRHGDARFIEGEHSKNDIWDEVHELNEKDDAGEYFDSDAPYTVVPVFRHAAPPAFVPEMTDAMAIDFIKDKYLFDDVLRATKLAWNACRSAMNK